MGRSADNDDVLAAVLNARTPAVCLVGKTHDFHVTTALGVTLEENREAIAASIRHLVAKGREALFDAEHFFDGYRANPDYALSCLHAALEAGARWIVLCDTNGGTLPSEVGRVTAEVIAAGIPGDRLGIHCHDDTGNAVANSLAAVEAGARQIQGTLNGLGERCGNANLTTLIPTLLLEGTLRQPVSTPASRRRRLQGLLQDQPDAGRHPEPRPPAVGALCRRLGLRPQGGPACQRHPEGPHHLRTHRPRPCRQRAGHPDVEPGRPVEPARPAWQRPGSRSTPRTRALAASSRW